jgi:hypothetical protein
MAYAVIVGERTALFGGVGELVEEVVEFLAKF